MFSVNITAAKLDQLRMLADWQLRELGFDPQSVTVACGKAKNARHGCPENWVPHSEGSLPEGRLPNRSDRCLLES